MQQLYLCRHGETEWALSGRHTGRTDISLTQKGREQTALLRKRLEGISFEKIFSSPLKRARESCAGLKVEADPNLMEFDYGEYEGLTTPEVHKINPNWSVFKDGAPGGESPAQVGTRADQFLKKVAQFEGKIAVFSHGHFLRILASRFLGLEPECAKLFCLSVASLSILGYERKQSAIVLWNDVSHL